MDQDHRVVPQLQEAFDKNPQCCFFTLLIQFKIGEQEFENMHTISVERAK